LNEGFLFSVDHEQGEEGKYSLRPTRRQNMDDLSQNTPFLIVRSLKNDDGVQKGYNLELGDVIRLGRIEYRVLEYQNRELKVFSLLNNKVPEESIPFNLFVKDCNSPGESKRQCRICLMDEHDTPEVLVNPCKCKGTFESVHIKCLQDWISSKVKKKSNPSATCMYWKKLHCEVCKEALPDLVDVSGEKLELVPIYRTEFPYILLERVFYDKTRDSTGNNSKTMILLSIIEEGEQIKMGRGHECDLRENDISVSRLHAYIKYNNGKFTIIDNNSKFGTLILLRKPYQIEKKKVALQTGRTVITFSLKNGSNSNSATNLKDPALAHKIKKSQLPADIQTDHSKHPPNPSVQKAVAVETELTVNNKQD